MKINNSYINYNKTPVRGLPIFSGAIDKYSFLEIVSNKFFSLDNADVERRSKALANITGFPEKQVLNMPGMLREKLSIEISKEMIKKNPTYKKIANQVLKVNSKTFGKKEFIDTLLDLRNIALQLKTNEKGKVPVNLNSEFIAKLKKMFTIR